jgi:uncharacterized SAM-binding protein YcdF (DUF218 family)
LLRSLERVYEPVSVAAAPDADAIVVLNGGVVRGRTASGVQWGESANRYFAGVDLVNAAKAKTIVFSSGQNASQGQIIRQTAIRQGIPPERIILTGPVFSTEDEARAVSEIPGIHSILLVTSAFHMPRAVLLFRARGLAVSPFPTDERALGRRSLTLIEFIPAPVALGDSEHAMREYYGLALYRTLLVFRPAALIHQIW